MRSVMKLVEGETFTGRIARGPIAQDDAPAGHGDRVVQNLPDELKRLVPVNWRTPFLSPEPRSRRAASYFAGIRYFGLSSQLSTSVIGSLVFSSTGFPIRNRRPSPVTA
jgi:hypothetical protein